MDPHVFELPWTTTPYYMIRSSLWWYYLVSSDLEITLQSGVRPNFYIIVDDIDDNSMSIT